ncbi:MAG: hypothetical protein ACRC0Y_11705 [Fusobacteriaceae bacterium]
MLKANGQVLGRKEGTKITSKKSIKCKKEIFEKSVHFKGTLKDYELLAILKITRNTFYKYKKEIIEEKNLEIDAPIQI